MTGFIIKLKSKKGQFIVRELSLASTIAELKRHISQVTDIQEANLHVLTGFPPRPLSLSDITKSLVSSGISSGETLIVEERSKNQVNSTMASSSRRSPKSTLEEDEALARHLQAEEEENRLRQLVSEAVQRDNINHPFIDLPAASGTSGNFDGILLKKVVPADNSCLFTSIRFVLNGKVDNEGSEMMRHLIAQEVAANPEEYSDAVLGKSNSEYCTWIQKPESWGGAIEVAILSNYYGIEIDVVDIQNAIINRFGEDKNYGLRVFLLFDGIHYDPLYMETPNTETPATIFPVEEIAVYQQAEQIANEAKSARQFTNVDKFTLRCMECDVMLVGQVQAQQHAKSTGHKRFGEI